LFQLVVTASPLRIDPNRTARSSGSRPEANRPHIGPVSPTPAIRTGSSTAPAPASTLRPVRDTTAAEPTFPLRMSHADTLSCSSWPPRQRRVCRSNCWCSPWSGPASVSFLAVGNTTVQLTTLPTMRGRVMALQAVAFLGSTPVGGPIAGWVSRYGGGRAGLVLGHSACLGHPPYVQAGPLRRVCWPRG